MTINDDIPSTRFSWNFQSLVGFAFFSALCWIGVNVSEIPLLKKDVSDISAMKPQLAELPVIKVQMEFIQKQLEHITSSESEMGRMVEENRLRIQDHELRIKTLEARHR